MIVQPYADYDVCKIKLVSMGDNQSYDIQFEHPRTYLAPSLKEYLILEHTDGGPLVKPNTTADMAEMWYLYHR